MNLHRIANSIVTRLLLFGVCIALIGVVTRYQMLTSFLREDLGRVVAAQLEATAQYVAGDIDYKIQQRQNMLKRLAATLPRELLTRPDDLHRWLGERHDLQPLFSHGLFVTDLVGAVVIDYPRRKERDGLSYADRDYVRDALSGVSAIGRPVVGRIVAEPVIPLAEPIKDADGRVQAVLVGITASAAPGFLDLLQQIRIGESGGFLLISPRDQIFVAATKPELIMKPTAAPGVNPLHDRAMAGFRGAGVTVNAQGIEEVAGFASVHSTGWFVVARLPTTEAFATVKRTQKYLVWNTPVIIGLFLFFATFGLMYVFRPLLRTADHADRMTLGKLPLAPLPVTRADEVGHLTEAFNRLLTKLLSSRAELDEMAHHDTLTGLPNRLLLADRMGQVLARARRNQTSLAIFFIDLDGFKLINDGFGHQAGDAALVEVAHRLSTIVREADTLARVGGDEFVLMVSDLELAVTSAQAVAAAVAEKCIEAMRPGIRIKGEACRLGLSIGIVIGDGSSSFDELICKADSAMYRAKQGGRGGYMFADPPALGPVEASLSA